MLGFFRDRLRQAGAVIDAIKDAVATLLGWLFDWAGAQLGQVWEFATQLFAFAHVVADSLTQFSKDVVGALDDVINHIIRDLRNWAHDAIDAAGAALAALARFVNTAVDSLTAGIKAAVDSVVQWALDHVWRPLDDAYHWLTDHVAAAVDFVARWGAALAQFAEKWLGRLLRWLDDPIGETTAWLLDRLRSTPQIIGAAALNFVNTEGGKLADWIERYLSW